MQQPQHNFVENAHLRGMPQSEIHRVLDQIMYKTKYPSPCTIPHSLEPPKTLSQNPPTIALQSRVDQDPLNSSKRFKKNVRKILEKWMADHWEYPYPDACEEEELISITRLERRQIKTWMTNYRRRKMNLRRAKKQSNEDLGSMFSSAPKTLAMLRYSTDNTIGNIPVLWGTKEYSPGVVINQDPQSCNKSSPSTCPPERDVMEALECLFDSKEKEMWKKS